MDPFGPDSWLWNVTRALDTLADVATLGMASRMAGQASGNQIPGLTGQHLQRLLDLEEAERSRGIRIEDNNRDELGNPPIRGARESVDPSTGVVGHSLVAFFSALGLSSPKGGSFGGVIQDYVTHSFRRIF